MSAHILGESPPLIPRSPWLAALAGFCLGPIGTAWTLGTHHALLTGAVYFASIIHWGGHGMFYGLIAAGLYGAAVVLTRNARLRSAQEAKARADARAAAAAMCRPAITLDAVPVVIELEASDVLPPAPTSTEPSPAPVEDARPVVAAAPAVLPEPAAPAEPAYELHQAQPEAAAQPASPSPPPAPRKRGRPRKAAA